MNKKINKILQRIIFGIPKQGIPIQYSCRVEKSYVPKEWLAQWKDNNLNDVAGEIIYI